MLRPPSTRWRFPAVHATVQCDPIQPPRLIGLAARHLVTCSKERADRYRRYLVNHDAWSFEHSRNNVHCLSRSATPTRECGGFAGFRHHYWCRRLMEARLHGGLNERFTDETQNTVVGSGKSGSRYCGCRESQSHTPLVEGT